MPLSAPNWILSTFRKPLRAPKAAATIEGCTLKMVVLLKLYNTLYTSTLELLYNNVKGHITSGYISWTAFVDDNDVLKLRNNVYAQIKDYSSLTAVDIAGMNMVDNISSLCFSLLRREYFWTSFFITIE